MHHVALVDVVFLDRFILYEFDLGFLLLFFMVL